MPNLEARLWSHQIAAIQVADRYLSKGSQDGRSALITMPTGTGKSAVIAGAIGNLYDRRPAAASRRHILVVAPWRSVVDQLTRDLTSRVWEHTGAQRPPSFPPVRKLPATAEIDTLQRMDKPQVFVTTTAKILRIYDRPNTSDDTMKDLFAGFAAVFMDECHYEPAPRWSEAIRAIACPAVLLTATPYRNDNRSFNVDPDYQYRYPHHQAVREGVLRTPEFVELSKSDLAEFAREFFELFEKTVATHPDTRAIIRCSNPDQITDIVRVLRSPQYGKSAIGIHDSFRTDPATGLYRTVPNADEMQSEIWVHQYKLVEGIDNAKFRLLAFYEGLGDDRAVVQQIGRVLRNPQKSTTDSTAWVSHRSGFDVEEIWENYKNFDLVKEESQLTRKDLVNKIVSAAPTSMYHEGHFRVPLDTHAEDAWRHLKIPLAARIFRTHPQLNLSEVASRIQSEWLKNDREVQSLQYPSGDTIIITYVAVNNSPFLRTAAFTEGRFGFTVLRHTGNHLFMFDTEGRTPDYLKVFPLESPSSLSRLFAEDSRLTTVSLANTDVGHHAIRARTIRAAAIDEVAPDLSDYAYVCSVAEGYPPVARNEDQFRRYVGISRSRLRDTRRSTNTFAAFVDWSDSISRELTGRTSPAPTFLRYADTSKLPKDTTPLHILLDVVSDDFERQDGDSNSQPLILGDYASNVHNGSGTIEIDQNKFTFNLSWDAIGCRYEFSCPDLEKLGYRERFSPRRDLVSVINAEQRFRIVPKSDEFMYVYGHFAQPIRPDTAQDRFWLLESLRGLEVLTNAKSEKGKRLTVNSWEDASVFGVIDQLGSKGSSKGPVKDMAEYFDKLEVLFCGDLGSEIADFIAIQENRIAFIHAKAAEGRKLAPSALHDVVAQAMKNLMWLQPMNNDVPQAAGTDWNRKWTLTDRETKVTQKVDRQRVGALSDGPAVWAKARSVIRNPNADREVWLVLGGTLSKDSAIAAVQEPTPELIQLYALLQSAWSAASQVGVRLRVFCSR